MAVTFDGFIEAKRGDTPAAAGRGRYPASLEHRECSESLNRFDPSKPPEFFWRTPFMRRDGNRSAEKLKSEIAGAERIRRDEGVQDRPEPFVI